MAKILVQFDGSNFYKKAKKTAPTLHLTHFNYASLASSITKVQPQTSIYYVGEIKKYPGNKKSELLYASQQSLFFTLFKQKITVKLGYLLMSNGVFHEKGVDVQIAVDMVRGAIKNEYDTAYLFSSDTDLIPAIKTAREEGKKVVYVTFENMISCALQKNCSSYVIITQKNADAAYKINILPIL